MRRTPVWLSPCLAVLAICFATTAHADWSQGFETDTDGWFDGSNFPGYGTITRVSGPLSAASGSYYAEVTGNPFTRFGGYNSVFPTGGYTTSLDIYLDTATSAPNDTQFDYSSAINNAAGTHRRDFIFSVGFYDDGSGPAVGTGDRYVISASNNSPGWPGNPARSPIAITASGWYTFQHKFYDSGGGVLAVLMSVLDSSSNVLGTWTLSDPTDIIGTTVGGNRYGWFANNEFASLSIDNSSLTNAVPEPSTLAATALGLLFAVSFARRRRTTGA